MTTLKILILIMALATFINSIAIAYLFFSITDLFSMYNEFLLSFNIGGTDV